MKLGNYYFKFDHDKIRLNSIGNRERSSTLSVYTLDQEKGEDPIWKDVIIRFHKDPYDKEVARKILMKKFMKFAPLTKEDRIEMWEQYRKSKPGGRW